ncbi:hypothetical protein ACP275_13G072100 [Erythranthe tilingii]
MAEIETLGILDEIQSIVSDKLQVVSYKWLSRNFLVSSNTAKRLLQEFVEKYGNGLEVIYSLSGWMKNNPSTYHIRLVSKHKLSDAKQEFDGDCSVQVYSIQACLPKDPATLWNHEFVQAEYLFKQPPTVDNCLLDNRFCGVSSSFIKRIGGEAPLGTAHQTTAIPQLPAKKVQQSSPNAGIDFTRAVKTESRVKVDRDPGVKLAAGKEKVPLILPNKKGQSDKSSSGNGSALASMWGRASTKPKPETPLAQANNSKPNTPVLESASAEAQICARESVDYGSSEEDGEDFNVKRTSNGEGGRKRRVVFDYSDEEDEYRDAVSLSSPDPPKKSSLCNSSFEEKENEPKINEVKQEDVEKVSAMNKGKKNESPTLDKPQSPVLEIDASVKGKVTDAVPKRRKVFKTRIDERGREVTEVVWEGEEPDAKCDSNSAKTAANKTAKSESISAKTAEDNLVKSESNSGKTAESNPVVKNATSRAPVAKKSPAVGNTAAANKGGRGGNKKAVNKDPKQGNILSFFKKS